ncbi:MAG: calcium-binding protein [Acidiferrobacteraceae bacterium]
MLALLFGTLPKAARAAAPSVTLAQMPTASAIVLNLGRGPLRTTSARKGVYFDWTGDGFRVRTGWITGNEGLLVLDRKGNGAVDGGQECFGNQMKLAKGRYAVNGYAALAQYDTNHDGVINARDPIYRELRVWVDANHDGVCQPGELETLPQAGVASLSLDDHRVGTQQHGNTLAYESTDTDTHGRVHRTADVDFGYDPTRSIADRFLPISPAIAALPNLYGMGTVRSLRQAMAYDQSGTLQALVTRYVGDIHNAGNTALLDQILYHWTGTDAIRASARALDHGAPGAVSARKLATLEALQGFAYQGGMGPRNAKAIDGPVWRSLEAFVEARLVKQSFLKHYYNSRVYNQNTERWRIPDIARYFDSYFSRALAVHEALGRAQLQLFIDQPYLAADRPAQFEFRLRGGGMIFDTTRPGVPVMGTVDDDAITVQGGRHTVIDGGGNDMIVARGDHNRITAGDGADRITVGGNDNRVTAGHGTDIVRVRGNDNRVRLGNGRDRVTVIGWAVRAGPGAAGVTASHNTLHLGNGDDTVVVLSALGNNTVTVGNGSNRLQVMQTSAAVGGDAYLSAAYNTTDRFRVGNGDNLIIGSAGSTTYVFDHGIGHDTIQNNPEGITGAPRYAGPNVDTLQIGRGVRGRDVSARRRGPDLVLNVADPVTGAIGTITLRRWFRGPAYRVQRIVFDDGTRLTEEQLQALGAAVPGTGLEPRVAPAGVARGEVTASGRGSSATRPALTLAYDRNPAACHYLLHLYNHDLARKGYVDTRAHRVFRTIHWVRIKGRITDPNGYVVPPELAPIVRLAVFDITNSGHPEPVVRNLEYIGNDAMGTESLSIVYQAPKDAQQWLHWEQVPHGHIRGGFPPPPSDTPYFLKHAPKSWVAPPGWPYRYPALILSGLALRPVRYHGVFYVSISPYADYGRIIMGGPFRHWIVIGKYRPDDTFEDVCYFRHGALRSPHPPVPDRMH